MSKGIDAEATSDLSTSYFTIYYASAEAWTSKASNSKSTMLTSGGIDAGIDAEDMNNKDKDNHDMIHHPTLISYSFSYYYSPLSSYEA